MKLLVAVGSTIALVSANYGTTASSSPVYGSYGTSGVYGNSGASGVYGNSGLSNNNGQGYYYGANPYNGNSFGSPYVAPALPVDCGNGTFNPNSRLCNCDAGNAVNQNGVCALVVCGNGSYSSAFGRCVCDVGNFFNSITRLCVTNPSCGDGTGNFNSQTLRCDCNIGNILNPNTLLCEAINCGNGSYVVDRRRCVCNDGNYLSRSTYTLPCVPTPACGNGTFNEGTVRCDCNAGNYFNSASQLCELVQVAPAYNYANANQGSLYGTRIY